jgi:hypothetical protein
LVQVTREIQGSAVKGQALRKEAREISFAIHEPIHSHRAWSTRVWLSCTDLEKKGGFHVVAVLKPGRIFRLLVFKLPEET